MKYTTDLSNYSENEIAKYLRLSLMDNLKKGGIKDESESIANQRNIINNLIDLDGKIY